MPCEYVSDSGKLAIFGESNVLINIDSLYPSCPVTEYFDPQNIWTPGPQLTEIFGPPLKYFIPQYKGWFVLTIIQTYNYNCMIIMLQSHHR